jgi:hypothetical protein
MDQEITQPERAPQASSQATGTLGCFLAAAGATMLAASMLSAAFAASVWAFSNLFGFPQSVLWVLLGLSLIPALWATIWTAGRAWHVERRLAQGLDVDTPVFKLLHYWRRT